MDLGPVSDVEAWLKNARKPAPIAADLAAWIAHAESVAADAPAEDRAAMLRLATIAVDLDAYLKDACDKLAQWNAAARDAAHTAQMALGRLEQQEPLVLAALSWRGKATDRDAIAALMLAADKYGEIVRRRS